MSWRPFLTAAIAAVAMAGVPRGASAQVFNVIDPGTLCRNTVPCGGTPQPTNAIALNDYGEVVGHSETDPFGIAPRFGFLYTEGALANLGKLGAHEASFATGVNNTRHVSGYASGIDGENAEPFEWTFDGGFVALPTFGAEGRAFSINNSNVIVGEAKASDGTHAVVWRNHGIVDLGRGSARRINVDGLIAGWIIVDNGAATHAAYWDASGALHDIGTLGGDSSVAYAVHGFGDATVVGSSQTADGKAHAFVWNNATGMTDLGSLGGNSSTAYDTNGRWIVGTSQTATGTFHAFLYDLQHPGMIDLNDTIPPDSGWDLSSALSINGGVDIVGVGGLHSSTRGFLLKPWSHQDTGDVGLAGDMSWSGGTFTVKGAGSDIWGAEDSFHFAYQTVWGDSEIVTRVTSLENTNEFAKAGLMIRYDLLPDAPMVIFNVKPDGGTELMRRTARGSDVVFINDGTVPMPTWLKLRRMGSTISAYISGDGVSWTWRADLEMPVFGALTYVGLAVTSHDTGVTNTATFDRTALRQTWTSRDVGFTSSADQPPGGAQYVLENRNSFRVRDTGADIWGASDDFHFVDAPMNGNEAEIIVRVDGIGYGPDGIDEFAKAGVMFRDSFDPGAPMVILDWRPTGDMEFMARSEKGGDVAFIAGAAHGNPVWLRLFRVDSTVQASWSSDGQTWNAIGVIETSFGNTLFGGLVVTSRDVTRGVVGTFSDLRAFSSRP